MQDVSPQDEHAIKASLERFEERFAVLRNENYGEFRWPRENLPTDINAGETILIKAIPLKDAEKEDKYEKMRRLLEELIN